MGRAGGGYPILATPKLQKLSIFLSICILSHLLFVDILYNYYLCGGYNFGYLPKLIYST